MRRGWAGRIDRVPTLVALLCILLALAACRLEVGGPDGGQRGDAAPAPSGFSHQRDVRAGCLPAVPLVPFRSLPTPEPIDRILRVGEGLAGEAVAEETRVRKFPSDEGLLAVMGSGLWHWDGTAWAPVLQGGRDYVLREDTILRLAGERVEFFRIRAGSAPRRVRSVTASGHDASVAVAGDMILLHSIANHNNHLLTQRAIVDGKVKGHWVPVQRDFVHLFMNDFDALLRDAGLVRAAGAWVVFVPLLGNPIRLFHADSQTIVELSTPSRGRGRVVTVGRKIVRDEQACAGCRREVHEVTTQRFERIHADAAFDEGSLWVLGSEIPGSTHAVVHRFPLDSLRGSAVEAFRLGGLATPPRALAVAERLLIVASEDRLYWFSRPQVRLKGGQSRRNHSQGLEARSASSGGGACE